MAKKENLTLYLKTKLMNKIEDLAESRFGGNKSRAVESILDEYFEEEGEIKTFEQRLSYLEEELDRVKDQTHADNLEIAGKVGELDLSISQLADSIDLVQMIFERIEGRSPSPSSEHQDPPQDASEG